MLDPFVEKFARRIADESLDEMTLALLEALEIFEGRDAAFEAKHPRNLKGTPGAGKFRSLAARIAKALEEWADGKGNDNPFEEFDKLETDPVKRREQFRKVAKERGIPLKRGASEIEIKNAILDDVRKGGGKSSKPEAEVKPEPKKAAPKPAKKAPAKKATPEKAAPKSEESGVAGLPRASGKPPTASRAAKDTNPNFGSTTSGPTYRDAGKAGERYTPDMGPLPSGAYEENCSNVVQAFEMRMRGYDVEAAPLDVLDKHGYASGRTFAEIDALIASAWRGVDGKPHGRSFSAQQWRDFDEIHAEIMRDWPDGGRGTIFVGTHIYSVVKENGKVKHIEAQYEASASRAVTAQYVKKFRQGKVVRLDDLVPTDGILESLDVPSARAGKDTRGPDASPVAQATGPAYTGPAFKRDDALLAEFENLQTRRNDPSYHEMEWEDQRKLDDRYYELLDGPQVRRAEQEKQIDEWDAMFRAEHAKGMRKEAAHKRMAEHTKKSFEGKKVAVRVTPATLGRILDDGRFRTQFETGKSGGLNDTSVRGKYEAQWFGLDDDTDPTTRPIYGYVMVDGDRAAGQGKKDRTGDETDALSQYGRIQVVLKDSVRTRTTAMVGDSLDFKHAGLPSPIDDPDWRSFTPSQAGVMGRVLSAQGLDRDYSDPSFHANTYVEAQVHGGVTVDDVQEILFPVEPSAAVKRILKAKGISWRVVR